MPNYKYDRIAADMRQELNRIILGLKDPRIIGLNSITHVSVTNDLSYATIHVSNVDGMDAAKSSVKGLQSASGYIKREIGSVLSLRKMPELRFVADDSIESGNEITKKIDSLHLNDIKKENTDEPK